MGLDMYVQHFEQCTRLPLILRFNLLLPDFLVSLKKTIDLLDGQAFNGWVASEIESCEGKVVICKRIEDEKRAFLLQICAGEVHTL